MKETIGASLGTLVVLLCVILGLATVSGCAKQEDRSLGEGIEKAGHEVDDSQSMSLDWLSIDWFQVLSHLVRLGLACLLALPIAWDREKQARSLGLRTFPLVAMASTGYLLISQTVLGWESEAQARILQGLITGIGFLGGGAIVKQGVTVHGTATAASIWNTAAIGAAVAYGRFEIALALSAVNFLTLRWLRPLKDLVDRNSQDTS